MTNMPWQDFPDLNDEPTDVGADYVPPADRVPEWAEMAASFARDGFGADEIATMLCVDEPTVSRLLQLTPSAP